MSLSSCLQPEIHRKRSHQTVSTLTRYVIACVASAKGRGARREKRKGGTVRLLLFSLPPPPPSPSLLRLLRRLGTLLHSAFSRTSPNSTPVTGVYCTNPVIDNKRSRNDQKKNFKNTFKNQKLPTILTIWSFQR